MRRLDAPILPPPVRGPDIALLIVRFLIGGVLFYAGFMKAIAPHQEFAAVIDAYHLVPYSWAEPLSIVMPWLEMWIGTFLFVGYERRFTASAAAALFAGFLIFIGSALARHIDLVSCGCFGSDTLSPKHTLVMDSVLFVSTLLVAATTRQNRRLTIDAWIDR